MTDVLHLLIATSSICLGFIALVLAWWAWTRLKVSVFVWLVLSRVSSSALFMTLLFGTSAEQRKKAQGAVDLLKNQPDADITDKFLSLLAWEALPSVVIPCLLLLLAAVELAWLGSNLHPDQKWPVCLLKAYRFRLGLGLAAVACSLLHPLIFWVVLPPHD